MRITARQNPVLTCDLPISDRVNKSSPQKTGEVGTSGFGAITSNPKKVVGTTKAI